MTFTLRVHALFCFLVLALCLRPGQAQTPVPAAAQDAFAKEEAELVKQCVSTLSTFASVAESNKIGQRAKQAYDLCLQYNPNQEQARSKLGFRKEKDQWIALPPEKRKKWVDRGNYEGRFKVMDEWAKTAIKLGELHRKLGLKLKEAGNLERATYHLDKAVYYNAADKEANLALGYKEGPGFYGTDEQITFAKKMKEIEFKAVEFARKDYPVQALPLEQMPIELQNLRDDAPEWMKKPSFDIFGAKSEHFTVWTRGTQENADTSVKWAERALEFGVFLLGEDRAKKLQFVQRAARTYAWQGFLFTSSERETLLKAQGNKHVLGNGTPEDAMRFVNNTWRAKEGLAVIYIAGSPRSVQDHVIADVFMDGLLIGRNDGIGQGIVHAVTWYMKATSISRWGALPEGSVSEDALRLPEGTNWWMRTVRDQAVSGQDMPFLQVPREKLSRFRNDTRLKSWSMMTWMMAAYPDKWLDFFLALPNVDKKVPTLEDLEPIVVAKLGKASEQIDAEWREWARGDSGVAFGTGYGPPLHPERPSKIELAALDRINVIRSQPSGYTWPKDAKTVEEFASGTWAALPTCEMDAETSFGCDLHSKYITNHPELAQKPGPEIHEEDPAHEDFTRQGQQAGQGNIVTGQGERGPDFAEETVDLWVGVPYHRFPMLEHNIKRLGYSYVFENGWSVAVLDMGSLEEPYDPALAPRLVAWPPPAQANVPLAFPAQESPNPLEDQPEGQNDPTKCGYPVSLQLQQELARLVTDSSIELFESRKGGKTPRNIVLKDKEEWKQWTERCKPKEVPTFVHTPKVPLNKKRDLRDAIFCIPKEPLEPNKQYQVRVMLRLASDPFYVIWEFQTGGHSTTLKLKEK